MLRKTLLATVVLLLASSTAGAQTFGTITGIVTDPTGAVVPGAQVTATNTATNVSRDTVTNAEGLYVFPSLVPGPYSVRVQARGFRTAVATLNLQVAQTARVDFALEVGQTTETIEVSATWALLATDTAAVGTVIEERRIVDLPLNSRNYLQLVALSPNVSYGFSTPGQVAARQGGTRGTINISVAGMRGVWNYYTLDGIANTDVNFNLYILLPSVEALQEFKVQTGIYPAEFGRAATQINVSTKPGSNDYHATLFWFHRNSAFDADPFFFYDPGAIKPVNPPFRWHQYGFTASGRIIRDRLFWMGNYEGFKERVTRTGFWTTATKDQRRGDFSKVGHITVLKDPLNNYEPFPGKIIPASRLDKTAQKLLEFYPEPNLVTDKIDRNYQRQYRDTVDKVTSTIRVDFNENRSSQWFARVSWNDETTLYGGLPLSGRKLLTQAQQYMFSNTRTLSPTKVNEFRFGITDIYNELGNELGGVRNVVKELGLPVSTEPPSVWGIPTISIQSPYSGFGNEVNGPFVIDDRIIQVINNFSFVRGRHSLRFGGEYRYDYYDQVGNEFPRGRFTHDARFTGDGFADFITGHLSRAEIALALADAKFRASSVAAYIDDTFRLTPKLTLNLGLRWEFFQPYHDKLQKTINSLCHFLSPIPNDPNPLAKPIAVRMGDGDFYEGLPFRYLTDLRSIGLGDAVPIRYARDSKKYGKRLINNDLNNWAPRIGIAYSPTPRWSFRTGFGIFYSAESGNSRFDMNRAAGGRLDRMANYPPQLPDVTWSNFLDPTLLPVRVASPFLWGVVPEVATPYTMMYLFNVQRGLTENSMLEINFTGSQHRKVQGLQNRNAPIPGTTSMLLRRPAPEYGIQQIVVNGFTGNYNGLGLKFTHRTRSGVSINLAYTWSKALDSSSAIRGTGADIFPQDNRCLKCEYGYSAYNTPHRFVASPLVPLPFGRGQRWLNKGGWLDQVFGGWQVASILTIQSGRPINTGAGWDAPGTGTWGDPRLNSTGKHPYLPKEKRNTETWLDVSAFAYVPGGTFGNISRNRLLGPGQLFWDFSTLKDFRVTEGHSLQFRFEAFNFPNHPVWGNYGASWGRDPNKPDPAFGRIRSTATSMRQIQFGLKYRF